MFQSLLPGQGQTDAIVSKPRNKSGQSAHSLTPQLMRLQKEGLFFVTRVYVDIEVGVLVGGTIIFHFTQQMGTLVPAHRFGIPWRGR